MPQGPGRPSTLYTPPCVAVVVPMVWPLGPTVPISTASSESVDCLPRGVVVRMGRFSYISKADNEIPAGSSVCRPGVPGGGARRSEAMRPKGGGAPPPESPCP